MVDYAFIPKFWHKAEPLIQVEGRTYSVDLQNQVFANPWKPDEMVGIVTFSSKEGRRLCKLVHIVECSKCGISIIVPGVLKGEELRCVRCFSTLVRRGHAGRPAGRQH